MHCGADRCAAAETILVLLEGSAMLCRVYSNTICICDPKCTIYVPERTAV